MMSNKAILFTCLFLFFVHLSANAYPSYFEGIDEANYETRPSKVLYVQYLENANHYSQENMIDEAKEILWKAIYLFPDNPDAYINLGVIRKDQGDRKGALRVLEKAKKLAGQDYYQQEILFYNLGICYFELKNYLKAKEYLQKAVDIYSDFLEAKYYLILVDKKIEQERNKINVGLEMKKFLGVLKKNP